MHEVIHSTHLSWAFWREEYVRLLTDADDESIASVLMHQPPVQPLVIWRRNAYLSLRPRGGNTTLGVENSRGYALTVIPGWPRGGCGRCHVSMLRQHVASVCHVNMPRPHATSSCPVSRSRQHAMPVCHVSMPRQHAPSSCHVSMPR